MHPFKNFTHVNLLTSANLISTRFLNNLQKWLSAFLIFCAMSSAAQTYTYHAFPQDTGIWRYGVFNEFWNQIGWHGDVYTAVVGATDTMQNHNLNAYYEDNKKLFFRQNGGAFELLFDFNLTVGDTVVYVSPTNYNTVIMDDSTGYQGRRMLTIANNVFFYPTYWVEGIGNVSSYQSVFEKISLGSVSGGNWFYCAYADSVAFPCSLQEMLSAPMEEKALIKAYPNPATTRIQFNVPPNNIAVYDLNGRLVQHIDNKDRNLEMDVSNLRAGVYLLTLQYQGAIFWEKLTKE
jgi:hypothetical protein